MSLRVALVSRARPRDPMGFGLAEGRLVEELRRAPRGVALSLRVFGGRTARAYARQTGGTWVPSHSNRIPRRAGHRADLVHALGLEAEPRNSPPFVVMVHDLASLTYMDEEQIPGWTASALRRASRVMTPSEFTKRQVAHTFGITPDSITVIGTGLGMKVLPTSPDLNDSELTHLGLKRPLVLRMGGYTERKNLKVLLRAWPSVRSATGATLALVGPADRFRDRALAGSAQLDGLKVFGYLPSDLLARMLRSAEVLVSTSVYEGVGLPPLEAMSAGVSVVAIRSPTAEEFCGRAARLVENDHRALAAALVELLGDESKQAKHAAAGLQQVAKLSWSSVADRVVETYRSCAHEFD